MIRIQEKQNCTGCQACSQICPKNCIQMRPDREGFLYPVVDEQVCVHCGLCEKVCPVLHNTEEKQNPPKTYAACNLDTAVRLASSSGGVFTLLAEYVLDQGGVLYGAAMEGMQVKHIRVADRVGLEALRGSKYVQSDIGQTYIQAKADLESGKTVLFTGTPCQIEGLKAFLGKAYDDLIAVDIICHGVPAPMAWETYATLREKAAGAPAERISFRHKKYGWKKYAILFEFANKTEYVGCRHEDLFLRAFRRDLCLRPSCYQCGFKKVNRVSDMTLADFWGVEEVCPEMDDDRGTSLVMIHSGKGEEIFRRLSAKMDCREVPFDAAIAGNAAMIRSAEKPEHRDAFMERIQTEDFEQLATAYTKEPITAKDILKKTLKKVGLLQTVKNIKKRIIP